MCVSAFRDLAFFVTFHLPFQGERENRLSDVFATMTWSEIVLRG